LTNEQLAIYEAILSKVNANEGGIIFIDAPGGTGKTFLINLLLAKVRKDGKVAVAVASSGIAATLLDGGRTAHSAFKLPLDLHRNEFPVCEISKGSRQAKLLQDCQLIIWDESTMGHKKSFEALDRTLKDLRNSTSLFGGVTMVLSGDFRQTLPVIARSTPADELNASLKASYLWRYVKRMTLTTNMRVRLTGDNSIKEFSEQLLLLGDGRIEYNDQTGLMSFPDNFCHLTETLADLINSVFPNIDKNFQNHEWLKERAILAPKNESVFEINEQILKSVPGESKIYQSINTVTDPSQAAFYPVEYLESLEMSGIPSHLLELKIGVPVILLRNLDPPKLCNGTRLCVKRLHSYVIEATILTGKYH